MVSSWVYECFTITPCLPQALLSVPLLSHGYCFKFFLRLRITAWCSSVCGRAVHLDGLPKKAKAAARVLYPCSEVHKIIVSNLVQVHEVPWVLDDSTPCVPCKEISSELVNKMYKIWNVPSSSGMRLYENRKTMSCNNYASGYLLSLFLKYMCFFKHLCCLPS